VTRQNPKSEGPENFRMDGTSYTFSCMIAGFCCAASIMILLGTGLSIARISKNIADVARQEGKEWRFWKDRRQLFRFVSVPGDLIDSSDCPRLSEAKKALTSYRVQAIRSVAAALLLLSLGVGLMTPFPFYCLTFTLIALLMLLARGMF
jgi:hypothetical protein